MKRRTALHRIGSAALVLGASEIAWGAGIVAVRVWPAADYTRVTIESDARLGARHFIAQNPPRLVIDIDGIELSPALRELVGKVRADDPFIAGLRVGQYQLRTVRLVIDLKQATAPQLFTLEPVAQFERHRQHHVFFTQAGGADGARVFTAVAGVDGHHHQAVDAALVVGAQERRRRGRQWRWRGGGCNGRCG